MQAKYIEILSDKDYPHYGRITDMDNHKWVDLPEYDPSDPDNQPETREQYSKRLSEEYGGCPVFIGERPYTPPPPDPDKVIGKCRRKQGAILRYVLLYPGDVSEVVTKARWQGERVPVVSEE